MLSKDLANEFEKNKIDLIKICIDNKIIKDEDKFITKVLI